LTSRYNLANYDSDWPVRFDIEAIRLRSGLSAHDILIEHIGSTAVPGMIAKPVRHHSQSGWLDERGRLKGGHLLSLGVARKRAFVNGSELSVCAIRDFLLGIYRQACPSLKPDHETA